MSLIIRTTTKYREEARTMDQPNQADMSTGLSKAVNDILGVIEQDREREIITRRFGLFDRKETLEQIGELLGITRVPLLRLST